MAQGLLPEPQPQFGVSPEDLPRYAQLGIPPPGSPAYTPGPLAEEMLQQFPHESTFGQALSSEYIFPMQRHGSTGPVDEHAVTATSQYGAYYPYSRRQQIELNIAPPPPESYHDRRGDYGTGPEGYRTLYAYPTSKYPYFHPGGNLGFGAIGTERDFSERVPSDEERREIYRQHMIGTAKHEAGHRYHRGNVLEELGTNPLVSDIDPSRPLGMDIIPDLGFKVERDREGKILRQHPEDHEAIYLLQWVDAKLRGDKESMRGAQGWLDSGEEVSVKGGKKYERDVRFEGPYDVIAALQPGTPIRKKIEKWNDEANERLISEGRPPILNYRDYIDTAIGYTPKSKDSNFPRMATSGAHYFKDRPGERQREREADDSNLLKTLQGVGRQ